MENYKRKKELSQDTINTFKTIEMNKINTLVNSQKSIRSPLIKYTLASILGLFIIAFSIFLYNQPSTSPIDPNSLSIRKLSNKSYLVERNDDDTITRFYYNAHVVFENEPVVFNETFSYGFKYQYAPESLIDKVTLDIDAFTIDDYRTYIEIDIEGEIEYVELIVYNQHTSVRPVEIDSNIPFETLMTRIFELIEEYPPVYSGVDFYDKPTYQANPEVNTLEDQALIDAYIAYVENHYIDYHDQYGELNTQTATVFYDTIIVVDESGIVLSNTAHISIVDDVLLPESSPNVILDSFDFYLRDNNLIAYKSTHEFKHVTDEISGKVIDFKVNDMRYFYTLINLNASVIDLSEASYVKYTYILSYSLDPERETYESNHELFIYDDYLIVGPIHVANEPGNMTSNLFSDLIITFYDESDNMLFEIDLHPYN